MLTVRASEQKGERGENNNHISWRALPGDLALRARAKWEPAQSHRGSLIDPAPKGDSAPGIDHGLE